jgi:hypothetical protein
MVVLLVLGLVLAAFAVPAFAAKRNTHIDARQWFTSDQRCAAGWFESHGFIEDAGTSRACAKWDRAPGLVTGAMNLHGTWDYTLHWKVQCKYDQGDRIRHFDCVGQWTAEGYGGGGNVRLILDFTTGQLEWSFDGNLW